QPLTRSTAGATSAGVVRSQEKPEAPAGATSAGVVLSCFWVCAAGRASAARLLVDRRHKEAQARQHEEADQRRQRRNAELAHRALAMILDGAAADRELESDHLVRMTGDHFLDHRALAGGELLEPLRRALVLGDIDEGNDDARGRVSLAQIGEHAALVPAPALPANNALDRDAIDQYRGDVGRELAIVEGKRDAREGLADIVRLDAQEVLCRSREELQVAFGIKHASRDIEPTEGKE